MKNRLPADFLWGNSVSSMQTEGAWNEGGKGMSVYDIRQPAEFASDWKVATDSYHRYREDFDLMQDLGMNCYRFQIALEPGVLLTEMANSMNRGLPSTINL